jgi:hypothetical protein
MTLRRGPVEPRRNPLADESERSRHESIADELAGRIDLDVVDDLVPFRRPCDPYYFLFAK